MIKHQKAHYNKGDDPLEKSVSYEEIVEIMKNRHDYERFGDSDTY